MGPSFSELFLWAFPKIGWYAFTPKNATITLVITLRKRVTNSAVKIRRITNWRVNEVYFQGSLSFSLLAIKDSELMCFTSFTKSILHLQAYELSTVLVQKPQRNNNPVTKAFAFLAFDEQH